MSPRSSRSCRFLIVLMAALAPTACGSTRRLPPLAPPPALSAQAANGQVAFMEKCNRCHPAGEAGLGPALNDKPFPNFLKRFQVRHGLGVMPHFSDEELSDAQLDAILEYLEAVRGSA
jgi:mono/diheme cytochrome c family protein